MCTHLLRKQTQKEKQQLVTARTMDFGTIVKPFPVKLKPNLVVNPRNLQFPVKSPTLEKLEEYFKLLPKKPLHWTNTYGFVAMDVGACILNEIPLEIEDISPIYLDGMNEKGLSAASLWLSGSEYQEESDRDDNLMFLNVVAYALGMCANVTEVKEALSTINIVCPSKFLMGYPAHYIFVDADPKSKPLVVEYLNGVPVFHDVPNGVLTNYPAYNEMLKEQERYKNLTVYQKPHESPGLLGLPADSSSISRFARATKYTESIYNAESTQDFVSSIEIIVQDIQVPLGTVVDATSKCFLDYTQWTVVRDHLNLNYYYKTFDNQTLKKLNISAIDFESTKVISVPISEGEWYVDETKKFI